MFARRLFQKRKPTRKYILCPNCRRMHYYTHIELRYYAESETPLPQECRMCRRDYEELFGNIEEKKRVANLF